MEGRFSIWRLAIAALGLNLWAFLLLVPLWHHGTSNLGPGYALALVVPLVVLGVALYLGGPVAVSVAFPLSLLIPLTVATELKLYQGAGPATIVLVSVAFLAYQILAPLLLRGGGTGPESAAIYGTTQSRKKPKVPAKRHIIYGVLLAFSALGPLLLLYGAMISPETRRWAGEYYPLRKDPALTLLAIVATGLWLVIFFNSVLEVAQNHIRGDKAFALQLRRFRSRITTRQSQRRLYLWASVAILLGLAAVLL
jgi:hypothetical protein